MKTTLLLPNGFKKIGWAIFVPAFLSSAPFSSASRAKKSKTK